jgi:hypothetical protein
MNKSKIVNKCRGLIRLPLLLKTHVGGRFLFFRRWYCRYKVTKKSKIVRPADRGIKIYHIEKGEVQNWDEIIQKLLSESS